MRLVAKSPEQVLAESRQLYREAVGSAPQSEVRNTDALLERYAPQRFRFHGVQFVAAATTPEDGVALMRWQREVQALDGRNDEEALERYTALQKDLRERLRHMARPERWRDRVRHWRRNPFRDASEADLAVLVGFFSACRMKPHVRYARMN